MRAVSAVLISSTRLDLNRGSDALCTDRIPRASHTVYNIIIIILCLRDDGERNNNVWNKTILRDISMRVRDGVIPCVRMYTSAAGPRGF